VWIAPPHALPMSRILLVPVAVLLAAGGVVLGPGEQAPAQPPTSVVSTTGHMGVHVTHR
jgi:hypothetical protein